MVPSLYIYFFGLKNVIQQLQELKKSWIVNTDSSEVNEFLIYFSNNFNSRYKKISIPSNFRSSIFLFCKNLFDKVSVNVTDDKSVFQENYKTKKSNLQISFKIKTYDSAGLEQVSIREPNNFRNLNKILFFDVSRIFNVSISNRLTYLITSITANAGDFLMDFYVNDKEFFFELVNLSTRTYVEVIVQK